MKNKVLKYATHIRCWHWLNAIVITGSLSTVLVNSNIFDKKDNTDFITKELKNVGVLISSKQAREVERMDQKGLVSDIINGGQINE